MVEPEEPSPSELAAEALSQLAVKDASLLVGGDPWTAASAEVSGLSHEEIIGAAVLVLQRFASTVTLGGRSPALAPLATVTEEQLVPALRKMSACIENHAAFQSAFAVTPLLKQAATLAAQCCCLAARSASVDGASVDPFVRIATVLSETLIEAVADRVEHFRPLDAKRISSAHRVFLEQQAEAKGRLTGLLDPAVWKPPESLAPMPLHFKWANDELRALWEERIAPKHGDSAPREIVVALLAQAASVEVPAETRERRVRRAIQVDCETVGLITAAELNQRSVDIAKQGGLTPWVNSLLKGDMFAPATGAIDKMQASMSTIRSLATTRSTAYTPYSARSSSTPSGTRRGFGLSSSFSSPRGTQKSFALSGSISRGCGAGGSFLSDLDRSSFQATQKLIMSDTSRVRARCDVFSDTPLHHAATHDDRNAPLAALLLRNGADANAEDRHLQTPLHTAASTGHGSVARELISGGADIRKADRWRITPLHRAAANGQKDVAEMLLTGGALAGASDSWGATPLHKAAANGQLDVAERLFASGAADANAEDLAGERPIHLAAKNGNYAIVKLLLEKGARSEARSRGTGRTAAQWAQHRGHHDVATLLQQWNEWAPDRAGHSSAVAAF